MTQRDSLTCIHEPFGDTFYYGPERMSERFDQDEKRRKESGCTDSTYKTIIDRLDGESAEVRPISFVHDHLASVSVPIHSPCFISVAQSAFVFCSSVLQHNSHLK